MRNKRNLSKIIFPILIICYLAIIIERSEDFTYLSFSDGVKIKWSADSMSIFLTVEEQYKNKVAGLCGNYNGDTDGSDFLLRDLLSFTNDSNVFGNAWKTDSSVKTFFS